MARLARAHRPPLRLVDYTGHPEAERVLVVMGSGGETVARDGRVARTRAASASASLQVRLYRPFPAQALIAALPASVRRIAVLDRTKEPGSLGEPLFLDVVAALAEAHADGERAMLPRIVGGRYGLSSKEFTPGMVAGVFDELARERPRRRFTIGINDDVSGTSLPTTPRSTSSRRTPCARSSSASARTARSARTRTRSRSSARGGPARAGLLRLRLEEVRLADRLAPALRAASRSARRTSSSRRASSAATTSGCSTGRRARPRRRRRDAAAQLPAPAGRGLGRAAAPGPGADPRQAHRPVRDRRRPDRPRGRPRRAHQHRPADLLLRHLRRAAAASRRSSGSRRAIAKTYGRRGAEVVERNHAAVDRALDGPAPRSTCRER